MSEKVKTEVILIKKTEPLNDIDKAIEILDFWYDDPKSNWTIKPFITTCSVIMYKLNSDLRNEFPWPSEKGITWSKVSTLVFVIKKIVESGIIITPSQTIKIPNHLKLLQEINFYIKSPKFTGI